MKRRRRQSKLTGCLKLGCDLGCAFHYFTIAASYIDLWRQVGPSVSVYQILIHPAVSSSNHSKVRPLSFPCAASHFCPRFPRRTEAFFEFIRSCYAVLYGRILPLHLVRTHVEHPQKESTIRSVYIVPRYTRFASSPNPSTNPAVVVCNPTTSLYLGSYLSGYIT